MEHCCVWVSGVELKILGKIRFLIVRCHHLGGEKADNFGWNIAVTISITDMKVRCHSDSHQTTLEPGGVAAGRGVDTPPSIQSLPGGDIPVQHPRHV